jgi:hypothetical protein
MRQEAITRILMVTALTAMVVGGGTASAQPPAGVIMPGQNQPRGLVAPPPTGFQVEMLTVEPFEMGDPVERAPFSAEIITEVTQELPHGNRIERRTTGAVARDSRGRVRREQQLTAIGPVVPEGDVRIITISDPVAGVHYSLDPARKVAMRSRPPRMLSVKPAGPEIAPEAPGGSERPDVRTEQLGTKEFEGVRAEGTRTVATLRAGAIGNLQPIEIVSERWYSPELHVVVYSRRADPRFGETIYRLTNIIRTEPDASLFQVPADYKREDVRMPASEPPVGPLIVKPPR